MSQNYQYNTIEEALRDLKEGQIVLVPDDMCGRVCDPGKY